MASGKKIGSIYAELSLRDKMTLQLNKTKKGLKEFGSLAGKFGAGGIAAVSTGLAIGAKHAIALGDDLQDLHAKTGIATGSLMTLGQAYKENGKDAASLGADINKMQKNIYEAAQADSDPFLQFGISAKELMNLKPEEQFFKIADAINKIEDPTKKTAAAMKFFGKSGGDLLPVFAGANLQDIKRTLGDMPALMDAFGEKFGRANDLMDNWSTKANQFFTGVAAGIIDDLLPALEKLNAADITSAGMETGRAAADVAKGFGVTIDSITNSIVENVPILGDAVGAIVIAADKMGSELGFNGVMNSDRGFQGKPPDMTSPGVMLPAEKVGALPDYLNKDWLKDAQKRADVMAEYNYELERANAISSKDQEKLNSLEKEWKIREEINKLMEAGNLTLAQATTMATDLVNAQDLSSKTKMGGWEQSSYRVNDYQSRGLALDTNSITGKNGTKEVPKLLANIYDVLKRAAKDGQLVWN